MTSYNIKNAKELTYAVISIIVDIYKNRPDFGRLLKLLFVDEYEEQIEHDIRTRNIIYTIPTKRLEIEMLVDYHLHIINEDNLLALV